jgi:Flp pilus assembly secretin CpaC
MRAERKMMALVCRRGVAPGLLLVLASAVFTAGLAGGQAVAVAAEAVSATMPGGMVVVHIDQAKILKLPERTATLVIGNPLIADAVVQPGGVVVITAKSYGATNLVALDRTGAALFDSSIQVVGPADKVVIVYRGVDRETYSCALNCERRTTIGDATVYFTGNLAQISTFGAMAQGAHQAK